MNAVITIFKRLSESIKHATYDTIITHDGVEHAGYLAFMGLLALFPFMVFIVAITGFIGQGDAGTQFIELLISNIPEEAAEAIKPRINEIISGPPQGLLTVAILGAIWTASSAVEGMRTILNRAYRVSTPPAYWFRRLMSIIQLLIFTAVLVLAMLLLIFAPIGFEKLQHIANIELLNNINITFTDQLEQEWSELILIFSALMMFIIVANLYYILPNINQTIRAVIPGAALVVAMWIGAASLFSTYLSNFDQVNLIYGSLGGIIATLIFFYIINLIFIFGAELNYHLVVASGHKIEEKEHFEEPEAKE